MRPALRRKLFGPTARSLVYLVAGVALFGVVVQGFRDSWNTARRGGIDRPVAARVIEHDPAVPERYVPPAEIVLPFF